MHSSLFGSQHAIHAASRTASSARVSSSTAETAALVGTTGMPGYTMNGTLSVPAAVCAPIHPVEKGRWFAAVQADKYANRFQRWKVAS